MKKNSVFLQKYGLFSLPGKNLLFLTLGVMTSHDPFPWRIQCPLLIIALDLSLTVPFMLIILPPRWLNCWQFSQERTRCSWNMSDNISCDHSQSGVVGGLFPTRTAPTSINLKHVCNLFHWEKMIMDDQNATKSNKSVGKMNKIIKNQSKRHF